MHRLPLLALLALLAVAPAGHRPAGAQEASPVASPMAGVGYDAMVDIGGRALHIACAGTGSPTILFEPGGPSSAGGTSVAAEVGPTVSEALGARFCSYDRAGTGQSDPDPIGVRTFTEAAADLIAVLATPELDCPCVVVGESLGGSIAQVAFARDPSGFAGLVLLDATYPGYADDFEGLAPADSPEAALPTDPYISGDNEERLDLFAGFRQVAAPAEPHDIPIIVVAHGAGNPPPCNWEPPCSADFPVAEFEAAWQVGQASLAEALGGVLVVAKDTGHEIASENPALTIELVGRVVDAVRDPSSWATPVASPTA